MNPIVYIVLNNGLGMTPGKAAAQAAHAAMLLEGNYSPQFTSSYRRTVIVLAANSGEQIRNLHEYLRGADIYSDVYTDEGKNEVDAFTITALAVEPIDSEDEEKREIFADLPLYGKPNEDRALKIIKIVAGAWIIGHLLFLISQLI